MGCRTVELEPPIHNENEIAVQECHSLACLPRSLRNEGLCGKLLSEASDDTGSESHRYEAGRRLGPHLHSLQNPASWRGWFQGGVPSCCDRELFTCFVPYEKQVPVPWNLIAISVLVVCGTYMVQGIGRAPWSELAALTRY